MLDPKLLREQTEAIAKKLATRGFVLDVAAFNALESERKTLQIETEKLQNERNVHSKNIGILKGQSKDASAVLEQVNQLGDRLTQVSQELSVVQEKLHDFCAVMPNVPHDSVPIGKSEDDNVEIARVGTPRTFSFEIKDH